MANALTLGTSAIRELDGLYSLNDLHTAAGGEAKHRPNQFLRADQTQALVNELETAQIRAVKTTTGRNGGTYACRELVIAYAAWISATVHLKVIRAFLDQHDAKLSAPPTLEHPDTVDVRALLLNGLGTTAELPLPGEVVKAINQRAWALAHDAYELLRQHMVQRLHYRHVKGYPVQALDTPAALADIATTTLGNALAHTAHREMRYALGGIRAALRATQEAQTQLQAHMAACTPQHPSNTQGAGHD